MYLHDIANHLPGAKIFTYADDSYVCITGNTPNECVSAAERIIPIHVDFLRKRGMVVNQAKTEKLIFSPNKSQASLTIRIGNDIIETKQNIKALGVIIDNKLSWDAHVHSLSQRLKGLTSGLWIIAKKLGRELLIRVLTAQVFSILYYSCQVWLTRVLSIKNLKRIERIHYAALRIAMNDRKKRLNRGYIDRSTRRMSPSTWMKYASTSFFIRITRDCMPTRLREKVLKNSYTERRNPQQLFSRDVSSSMNGRKSMCNWIGNFLRQIDFKWFDITPPINDDYLRINLKKAFPY